MEPTQCAIWNTEATLESGYQGRDAKIKSQRASGSYRIPAMMRGPVSLLDPLAKARLTTWIIEQRRAGELSPMVTLDAVEQAASARTMTVHDRLDRLFLALSERRVGPATRIHIGAILPVGDDHWGDYLSAWTECSEPDEISRLFELLEDQKMVVQQSGTYRLTAAGFDRLDAVTNSSVESRQAFVAMWFDPEMLAAWQDGFCLGISDAGYDPFRIDSLEHNGKIDDAIVAEIRRSRFLVADFTCGGVVQGGQFQPFPRGGVYYEAGLAHGLGMDVIFCCRRDRMEYLHFDTRQFAHIVWDGPTDLRVSLYNRIGATIKLAPTATSRPSMMLNQNV